MLEKPSRRQIRLPAAANQEPGSSWLVTIGIKDRSAKTFSNPDLAKAVVNTIRNRCGSFRLTLDALCLMPDHLHLVVQLQGADLIAVIGDVKSSTTRTWWSHGGFGPLWQRSFHDRGLRTAEDHEAAIKYVVENPVRGGIVTEWEDYPFTGGAFVRADK